MKVSIVIPCYNEQKTIEKLLKKIEKVDLGEIEKEIIIVDDASNDRTSEIIKRLNHKKHYKVLTHKKNKGKGSALRTGFEHSTGDIIIVQDGDLEPLVQKGKLAKMIVKSIIIKIYVTKDLDVWLELDPCSCFIGIPHNLKRTF